MEYFLSLIDDNVFYTPLTVDFNELTLSRFQGSHHIPQEFYPFNLYQRFKGVFFIKSTDCTHKDEKEISFEKASDRLIMKTKTGKNKGDTEADRKFVKISVMKYLILLASVLFLGQSCSVEPSMR
jgi:hypothetical protein